MHIKEDVMAGLKDLMDYSKKELAQIKLKEEVMANADVQARTRMVENARFVGFVLVDNVSVWQSAPHSTRKGAMDAAVREASKRAKEAQS
jgi:hypothetical protein